MFHLRRHGPGLQEASGQIHKIRLRLRRSIPCLSCSDLADKDQREIAEKLGKLG
jgi:hypothetical protein